MPTGFSSTDAGPGYGGEAVDISSVDHEVPAAIDCSRKLYVTATGDVKFDLFDGTTLTMTFANTSWHELAITKVYKTGTTATGMFLFW